MNEREIKENGRNIKVIKMEGNARKLKEYEKESGRI